MFFNNSFFTVNKLCTFLYFRKKKALQIMKLYIDQNQKQVLLTLLGILNSF